MWATIGWGVATFLLQWLLFGRNSSSSDSSSEQQPSKFTESNANQIGSPVPVALGRVLIKNPLISYYGDFDYKPYTEEYGMHTDLDAASLLWPILLAILATLIMPVVHPTQDVDSHGDAGSGTAGDSQNGYLLDMLGELRYKRDFYIILVGNILFVGQEIILE